MSISSREQHSTDAFMFRSFELHSRVFHNGKLSDYFMISSGTNQFPMPKIWKQSIHSEIETDFLYRWYTSSYGFQCITSAVKVYEDYISGPSLGIFSRSSRNVCMTSGGCGGASAVFEYLRYEYGDCCVIMAGMNYSLYDRLAKKHGFRIVELRCSADEDALPLQEDFRSLAKCPESEKEVYVFSIPNNPTGEMYSCNEFSDIIAAIKEHNGFIVLDTVCSFPVTRPLQPFHESLITLHDYWHSCAVVNSFSKTDSVAGLRLGYVYGPEHLVDFCSRLNASSIMNPPTLPAFPIVLSCMFRCMYLCEASGNVAMSRKFAEFFRRLFFMTSAGITTSMRSYAEHIFSDAEKYCNEYVCEILDNEAIIRANYDASCKALGPYIRKVSRFDAGFNFCVWLNRAFRMSELDLVQELIDATGVAVLTESAFSCRNVRSNAYFVRFSTACERSPYLSALDRLVNFLESEGLEH